MTTRRLENIFSPGSWFRFPVSLLKMMSSNEAIILAELINRSIVLEASLRDGWFSYSVEALEKRLNMSPSTQYRAIRRLQELNLVESELRGLPAKRQFRINRIGLEKVIQEIGDVDEQASMLTDLGRSHQEITDDELVADQAQSHQEITDDDQFGHDDRPRSVSAKIGHDDRSVSVTMTDHSYIGECIKELSEVDEGLGSATSKPIEQAGPDSASDWPNAQDDKADEGDEQDEDQPITEPGCFIQVENERATNFDVRCAKELCKAVVKNHCADRGSEIRKWAHQFRLLRTKDHVPKALIKEVLLWYVSLDWNDAYVPQAYSGSAFRAKFYDKLLPAMRRAKGPDEPETARIAVTRKQMSQEEALAYLSRVDDMDIDGD